MNQALPSSSRLLLAAGVAGLLAVSVLAFAGWSHFGSAIFLTLAESGMSWCF